MVLHTSTGKIVVLLVAGLLTVVSAAPASAAAGDPDLTFSQDGKLTTDFGSDGDIAHAVAVQTDGRIVVAGQALGASSGDYEFALVRYLANGNRDVTFGRNGKVTTGFSRGSVTFNDVAYGVAVQPADGKIVASPSSQAMARSWWRGRPGTARTSRSAWPASTRTAAWTRRSTVTER